MPPAVYTRGFIRTYCQYLGLNPDGMLDLFGPQRAIEDHVTIRPIPAEINAPRSLPVARPSCWRPDRRVVARRLPVGPVYFVPGERRTESSRR